MDTSVKTYSTNMQQLLMRHYLVTAYHPSNIILAFFATLQSLFTPGKLQNMEHQLSLCPKSTIES